MTAADSTSSRVAVVTGGAQGLGRGTAERLAADGYQVVVLDRSSPDGMALRRPSTLAPAPGLQAVQVDVADRAAVLDTVDAVVAVLGRLDVVVAAAGVAVPARPVAEVPPEDVERLLSVNVLGLLWTLQASAPHLRRGASVVVVSSQTAKQAWAGWGAYSGTKAFANALVQAMALELAANGVRVNALCPGTMRTAMAEAAFTARAKASGRDLEEELAAYAAEHIPLERMGTPADVAGAVAWLASEDSSFVTGATINLTGGEMAFF